MINRAIRIIRKAGRDWAALAAAVAAALAAVFVPGPPARADWLSARTGLTVSFLAACVAITVTGAVRRRFARRRVTASPAAAPAGTPEDPFMGGEQRESHS